MNLLGSCVESQAHNRDAQEKQAHEQDAKAAAEQAARQEEEASLTGLEAQRRANIKRNQQRMAAMGLQVTPQQGNPLWHVDDNDNNSDSRDHNQCLPHMQ